MGVSEATFYGWKHKHGGLMPSEVQRLRQLDEENARLRRLVADLSLDNEMLQEAVGKRLPTCQTGSVRRSKGAAASRWPWACGVSPCPARSLSRRPATG